MRPACYVFLPQGGFTYSQLRRTAASAESLDLDGLWLVDHMWARELPDADFLDGWTTVAALAEATSRLRLGVLVTCNGYRNPGMLAKTAATADHVSGGRIELGVGAGWMDEEYRGYGFPFPPIATRLAQLREALEVITRLFADDRTTYVGEHYRFDDVPFRPKPLQSPMPITIGGAGERVLMRLVARYAHRWNCPMNRVRDLASHLDALRRHCEEIGRDPADVTVSEQVPIVIGRDAAHYRAKRELAERLIGGFVGDLDEYAVCGTPDEVAQRLRAKRDAGVSDFAILFGDLGMDDTLQLFAERVVPALE